MHTEDQSPCLSDLCYMVEANISPQDGCSPAESFTAFCIPGEPAETKAKFVSCDSECQEDGDVNSNCDINSAQGTLIKII